jgi:tripartite motif-containing protein 71
LVWLDSNITTVPWQPTPPCSQSSCPKEGIHPLVLSKVESAGKHKLLVKAFDFAGNEKVRDIEFQYFPATGMKDEYAMHYFPLPDGTGNEDEEEHPDRPELAVNVMNGNLVYREQDVEVNGTATVDLKVERYYNSMLPDSENTEWGDGWTLAETPDLEPIDTGGSPAPDEAELLESSGALEEEVVLPSEAGAEKFDPTLQATLEKSPSGGYELTDETGESSTSVHFDETGQAEALLTEGFAKVDYSYQGGELAEIEVIDPSTFAADPEELEIPKPQLITSPAYVAAFGSNGSGDGQLKSPSDVAVDAAGNVYVADRLNNRVQKFDASGKFLSKFGALGSGNGQLNQPAALAIDSAGNIWVAEKGNSRIQKFNSKGEYLAKFGSKGSGNGQFASGGPEGVAVDSKGNVWVSDTYNGRLQKFNSAGEFLKAVSSKGSGLGQLGEPTGLDVAPDGKVWVADWQNNRVAVFNEAGEFVFQFGVQGAGNGAFSHPDEVEIDANGAVWVGDQGNHRVQQFNQGAEYVAQFGSYGSTEGKFNFAYPLGIATDSKGSLWVADVNNHRIQRWRVPIPKPTYASFFGANGSGDGQLSMPADVAVDLQGNLWVADKNNNRIQKYDPSGKFIAKYGSQGSGDGQFNHPSSIAVDRDGNILVADTDNHRIQKLDTGGQFLAKFGTQGSGNGQLNKPEEVVADAKGDVYVADALNGRVQRFDSEGKFLALIDSGQLYEPTGLDVDAAGNLWVADWQKHRISIFDSEGEFKGSFGSEGSGNGQFKRPDGIEIDNQGNVWVGDLGNNRIQRFDLAGNYVGQFGSYGAGAGQFVFKLLSGYFPMGIAADREGRLWVVDPFNNRVQQWLTANYAPAQPVQLDLNDGDARVEVEAEGGLIASVTGVAAGEHSYEHEGDFLVSHDGPEGETAYEKDAAGRLSEITLPNGTWAKVEYFSDNRVKSVSVSIEGAAAKTTYFEYQDGPPRRTIVDPEDAPHVTYDIGEDGSVFKWWNTEKPPELNLAGTLYDNREEDGALWPGDHELEATAKSEEGIASIEVLLNGTTLVDEKTCAQIPGPPVECKQRRAVG